MMEKRAARIEGKWLCTVKQLNNARDTNLKCRHHIKAMRTAVKFGFMKASDLVPIPDHPGKRRRKGERRSAHTERLANERRAADRQAAALAAKDKADRAPQVVGLHPDLAVPEPSNHYDGSSVQWAYESGASESSDERFHYL